MTDLRQMYANALDAGGGPSPSQHQFTQRRTDNLEADKDAVLRQLLEVGISPDFAQELSQDPDFRSKYLRAGSRGVQARGHQNPRQYPARLNYAPLSGVVDLKHSDVYPGQYVNRPARAPTEYYSNALRRTE